MEQEYFRLRQSKAASNPIRLEKLDREKYVYKMNMAAFERLDELVVAYYTLDRGLEICDLLESPCFMIADRLRGVFQLLEPDLQFKGIQLFPNDFEKYMDGDALKAPAPTYQIPCLLPTACLHKTAKIYDTGIVEEIVLDEDAVAGKNILKIDGLVEEIWIVSLSAAESILRRRPLAVALERVKVRE